MRGDRETFEELPDALRGANPPFFRPIRATAVPEYGFVVLMIATTQRRLTSTALCLTFIGASLAISTPVHAESLDLETELAASVELAAIGLKTDVEIRRFSDDWDPDTVTVPSITEIDFTLGGKQSQKLKVSSYIYEYSERKSPSTKKLSKSIKQGIAPTSREGGSWIRRGNISARAVLPREVSRADADTIITNVQESRVLQQQVASIDGMTPQEKAQSFVRIPLTLGEARPASIVVTECPAGRSCAFDRSISWNTEDHTNQFGETCWRTRVTAFFQNGYLAQWTADQDCDPLGPGAWLNYKWVGSFWGYGDDVTDSDADAPEPRLNYSN